MMTTTDAPVTVEQMETQAHRLDRIREDGDKPTLTDRAVLRETADMLRRLAALASAPAGDGVEALRALSDAATSGPWSWEQCGDMSDDPVVGLSFPADDTDCKRPYEGEIINRSDGDYRTSIAFEWPYCDGVPGSRNAALAVAAVNYVRAALAGPRAAVGEPLPADVAELVNRIGRAEWGATDALDADGHGKHVADSVRITAANFDQTEPQRMQGLYVEGTETVICHVGTSPNSPAVARALAGAWNHLCDLAALQSPPAKVEG